MNRRIIIAIAVVLFLAIGGGVFYYWQYYETPPEEWDIAEYSKLEDYLIKDTLEGQIIENKKAGISFKVPEGWIVKESTFGETYISLHSPDAIEKGVMSMETGCKIAVEVIYKKTSIDTIKKELKKSIWDPYLISNKNIKVGNKEALKNIVEESGSLNFYRVSVYVPTKSLFNKNKVYLLGFISGLEDKEGCSQEFEKFLERVSIK